MRTTGTDKLMDQSDPTNDNTAAKKSSATLDSDLPPWITRSKLKGMARIPTHAVRPPDDRRAYSRANLSLSLRLKRIAGQRENMREPLRTTNISSSGVLFACPHRIEPGTPVEIEICLVDRPLGRGTVRMLTEAHVVRVEPGARPGWHTLAVTFDDITFQREEPVPSRFQRP